MTGLLKSAFFTGLCLLLSTISAQTAQAGNRRVSVRTGLYGGSALPLGAFSEGTPTTPFSLGRAGYSDFGFCGGGHLSVMFGSSGLGWTLLDISAILNRLDRKGFSDMFRTSGLYRYGILIPAGYPLAIDEDSWWISMPVLTGIRFEVEIYRKFGAYASALGGMSVIKAPRITVTGVSDQLAEYSPDVTLSPGFSIESGFRWGVLAIGSRFSLTGFGKTPVTEHIRWGQETGTSVYTRPFPVTVCQLLIGLTL